MNYSELKVNVASWIHRSDLTALIPTFIEMARSRICHDLESMHIEKRVSATLSNEYTNLPTDLIDIRSIKINSRKINYFTEDQIVQHGYDSAVGNEAIYTIVANQLRVIGAPGSARLEIVYRYIPVAMSGDTDQDVILANYPQLYIYASELEYLNWSENEDRAIKVVQYYKDSINQINTASEKAKRPSGTLAVRSC